MKPAIYIPLDTFQPHPIEGYTPQYTISTPQKVDQPEEPEPEPEPEEIIPEPNPQPQLTPNLRFEAAMDNVLEKYPQYTKYREYLTRIVERESSFNQKAKNPGSPAWGYFQFMEDGKNWGNIRKYGNTSNIEEFLNNPEGQIIAGIKFLEDNIKSLSEKDWTVARQKGYTLSGLLAGMHLGGIGNLRKLLHENKDTSDTHWSSTGVGSSILKYVNRFNNINVGEIISAKLGTKIKSFRKFQSGAKLDQMSQESKDFYNNWYPQRTDISKSNFNEYTPEGDFEKTQNKMLDRMNNTRYHSNETLPNPRKKLINGLKSKIGEHAELDGVYIGYRNPNKNYIYYNNDVKSDRINKSVIAHEQAHSLENKASENKISQIIPQSDYKGVSNFEYESYLNDPREVHSRLMELRQHLNIDPKKVWSEEEIEDLRNTLDKDFNIFNRYTNKQILDLFNLVANNNETSINYKA